MMPSEVGLELMTSHVTNFSSFVQFPRFCDDSTARED